MSDKKNKKIKNTEKQVTELVELEKVEKKKKKTSDKDSSDPKNDDTVKKGAEEEVVPGFIDMKAAEKKDNAELLRILVPIIALILVVLGVILFVIFRKGNNNSPTAPQGSMVVWATDENGVAITDENGVAVTIIAYPEYLTVTDASGNAVTDANGNVVTTVGYGNINVTGYVPVTDASGNAVTDGAGNAVTEMGTIPQNPNAQGGGSVVLGTSSVNVTDGDGQIYTDATGVFTTIIELTSNPTPVAPASISWKTSLGGTEADEFSSIAPLSGGGYIASLLTNSKNGDLASFQDTDIVTRYTVLVKYNDRGTEVWRKALGYKRGNLEINDVIPTSDGGFYAVGHGKNVGNVTGKGYYDACVFKFDKDGNQLWYKTFGTSTVDTFSAGVLSGDGGIIAVGFVGNNNGDAAGFNKPEGMSACCIVKYDAAGNLSWKNIVGGNADILRDVCIGADGNIYCVGNFASGSLFESLGKTDGGIVKFNSKGQFLKALPLAGTGNENFSGITACREGGVAVVGKSNSSDDGNAESLFIGNNASRGGYDAYIVKVNSDLEFEFAKPLRGQYNDDLVSIVEKSDGSFIATGCSNSSTRDFKGITTRGGDDIIVAAFDKYGNLTWARSFGGTKDESASALCLASDGGYVIAGRTLSENIDMNGIAQYVNGKSVGVLVKFPK